MTRHLTSFSPQLLDRFEVFDIVSHLTKPHLLRYHSLLQEVQYLLFVSRVVVSSVNPVVRATVQQVPLHCRAPVWGIIPFRVTLTGYQ